MPQGSNMIASKSDDNNVYIFNFHKYLHKSKKEMKKEVFDPDFILKGHTNAGYLY